MTILIGQIAGFTTLVLRLAQPWSGGGVLHISDAVLREDSELVIATLDTRALRITHARREYAGESAPVLKLTHSIPRAAASGLAGSPVLFRGSVAGSVSPHLITPDAATVEGMLFADARRINALLNEAASLTRPPQGTERVAPMVFISYAHEDEPFRAALEKISHRPEAPGRDRGLER